ncbi:uncharacterized protein F5147DRAFT_763838 [Suillus discolor]|uniref:Uncharacterized protein n=1 Tax=Suillus discolor TaxID=1912936 RepID=A0A9P7EWY6_9AGAM|nr:uncharacterized protein F5147DRAFT_763838 [Suillus discolor]KAG2094874.1 hypothetical protein F5147DRAFT_763838 [Suillus discolor]
MMVHRHTEKWIRSPDQRSTKSHPWPGNNLLLNTSQGHDQERKRNYSSRVHIVKTEGASEHAPGEDMNCRLEEMLETINHSSYSYHPTNIPHLHCPSDIMIVSKNTQEWNTLQGLNYDEPAYDHDPWRKLISRTNKLSTQPENVLEGMDILLKRVLGTGRKTVARTIKARGTPLSVAYAGSGRAQCIILYKPAA